MTRILLKSFPSSRPAKAAMPARWSRAPRTLIMGLALLALASLSNAAILAYEPFNYSLGAINNGDATTAAGTPTATTGGGFTATWFAGGVGTTIVDGLAYPGLQTTNNALRWSASVSYQGENLAAAILPSTTPSVYVSFLYNAPSYVSGKTGFALDNGAASNQGYYMGMTSSGVFGVAAGDGAAGGSLTTATGPGTLNMSFNTTYFVVVKFDKDAGGAYYKSGDIWINPTPGASEPAASGTFTGSYAVMNKIADFLALGSVVTTDEIRLGTTWADVTPSNGLSGPETPTGLQVESSGDNTVSLSWTASTGGPISYNVKRAATSNGTYTVVGSTTAPTVTFTDSLTGGATYWYAVSAVNAGGESADSSPPVSATPTLGVPPAPSGLAATAGDDLVDLNWTAPAVGTPTSYNVKRSTDSGGSYTNIIGTTTAPTTSYTDATAVNDTTYYYVVSAVNAAGEGANSAETNATPAAYAGAYEPFDYPFDDNLLSGTPATGAGFGTWNGVPPGFIVSGLSYTDLPVANNAMRTPAGRQYVDLDIPLDSGERWISYLWNHSPGDPGGNKNGVYFQNGGTGLYFGFGLQVNSESDGYLALASMNTVGTAVDAAPTLLTTTGLHPYGGTKLIVLKIEFNTSGNNDTVTVYVNPVANTNEPAVSAAGTYSGFDVGTISGIGMQVAGGGDFITDEWRIGTNYAHVVDAVVDFPNPPVGLDATSGSNLVSLSWTDAGGGLPTGYNVKRSSISGGPYATVGSTTVPTVTYDDAVLGGSTYYYVVSAVNGVGESTNSAQVIVSPILAAPVTPGGLSATVGDSQVSLSWTASAFATSYDIKRATDINGPYTSIGTTGSLTFDDTDVANSVTYYYVVSAIGVGGTSPETSPSPGTPVGPVPLVLDIEPGVGITWFASNSVTYQVQWASEDLGTNTVWSNLGSAIIGDGATNTVFDPAGPPNRVYQVFSTE